MNNLQVIRSFLNNREAHTPTRDILNGIYYYKGQTLHTERLNDKMLILYNYRTPIAFLEYGTLWVNVDKYSVTTSKIQNTIKNNSNCYYKTTEENIQRLIKWDRNEA